MPQSLRKSFTAWLQLAAPPPTPRTKSRPPRSRSAARHVDRLGNLDHFFKKSPGMHAVQVAGGQDAIVGDPFPRGTCRDRGDMWLVWRRRARSRFHVARPTEMPFIGACAYSARSSLPAAG